MPAVVAGWDSADDMRPPEAPQPAFSGALYEEIIPTYCVGVLAQLAYKITTLSYFKIFSFAAYAALGVSLARKVFRDYTFFKFLEDRCVQVADRYPLLPIGTLVAAAHITQWMPALSIALSLATGTVIGFTFRIKWLSSVMHWSK